MLPEINSNDEYDIDFFFVSKYPITYSSNYLLTYSKFSVY